MSVIIISINLHNVNYFCCTIIVVGNKIDLPRREVGKDMAISYAKTHNMSYVETSAKTRHGVVCT